MGKLFCKIKSKSIKKILRELMWIYRYSMHYKGEIIWYILLGIIGTIISLAGGILSKYIIDVITDFDSGGIIMALIFFILMQLLRILINAFSSNISARINIKVNQQISAEVYDRLMNTDWESLSSYHSGDLLARIVGDVSTVSSGMLGWIPNLITRSLQFIGTFGVILYYDATLALLALISAPVTLLMSRFVLKKMRNHSEKMRELNSKMMIFNEESFQNIQTIKGFDLVGHYSEEHRKIQEDYKKVSLAYNKFSIQKNAIMTAVGTVVALVCFIWSIYRLHEGFISFGTMALFLQLSASLSDAFSALVGMIPNAINTSTSAGRIMEITQLPTENREKSEEIKAFVQNHINEGFSVNAENIYYEYEDGRVVLKNAHFSAPSGQVIAFIGPSGEGKTTILRLLLGIIPPQKGTLTAISEDGQALEINASSRSLFAYVPQGNTLFSGTVAENLRMIKPHASDSELWEALKIACADDFLSESPLGLNTPLKEQGGGFSQGQIQRICIARALLTDAPILLMDEATSALDIPTEHRVLKNITKSKNNRTCIITTHRLSVLEISDRIYNVGHDKVDEINKSQLETIYRKESL